MRLFIVALLITFNIFAQDTTSIINTRSAPSVISVMGEIRSVSSSVGKLDDGIFGINITVSYRALSGKLGRHIFSLPFNEVSIVQRDNDLFIVHLGQEVLLAHHEWWYSPSWMLSNPKVQLISNYKKVSSKRFSVNPQIKIVE